MTEATQTATELERAGTGIAGRAGRLASTTAHDGGVANVGSTWS